MTKRNKSNYEPFSITTHFRVYNEIHLSDFVLDTQEQFGGFMSKGYLTARRLWLASVAHSGGAAIHYLSCLAFTSYYSVDTICQ